MPAPARDMTAERLVIAAAASIMPEEEGVTEGRTAYPWQPASEIRGNLAIGNLRENLKIMLRTERGLHAETLLTAIGAIAGAAAHNAVRRDFARKGRSIPEVTQGERIPEAADLIVLKTKGGEKLYFGDALNSYLSPQAGSNSLTVWGFVAGAAVQEGLPQDALPSIKHLYLHVGKSFGGHPDVPPQHRPPFSAPEAARTLWPIVRRIFDLPPPAGVEEPPLDEAWWPIVASIVAGQLLREAARVVPPAISVVLIMEAAIAASKIDPDAVEAS